MGIIIPRPPMRSKERRTIEARLRAYHDAIQSGFTREEAMREAKAATSRAPRKRKPKSSQGSLDD